MFNQCDIMPLTVYILKVPTDKLIPVLAILFRNDSIKNLSGGQRRLKQSTHGNNPIETKYI